MQKVPVRLGVQPLEESPIVRDLRVLVDASRKLRQEVNDMVSRRPRVDLRAHLDVERRLKERRPPPAATANGRPRKKSK